jgi:MtN3 and saliva related transmembrane protein
MPWGNRWDMSGETFLGLIAACCTTFAFLPQVIKTWRTRSTKDISLGMFLVLVLGIILWLAYGLIRVDLPLVAANTMTLFLTTVILYFKLRYG